MSLLRCVWGGRLSSFQSLRTVSTTYISLNKPSVTSQEKESDPMAILKDGKGHKVDNLEKRFLVWAGKYKKIEDVPPTVSQETMEKARNKARIKIANYMMLATIIGCIGFIYSGKQAAKRGETVQKMNLDWHRQINEESEKQEK